MSSIPAKADGNPQTNRRSKPRTSVASIKIRCDGEIYVPDDWGLGGCRIPNYSGQLRPGTTVLIELFLNVVHEHDGLPIKAEVLRFEPENNNALALCFTDLSARDIADFCDTVDQKLSAEMKDVID